MKQPGRHTVATFSKAGNAIGSQQKITPPPNPKPQNGPKSTFEAARDVAEEYKIVHQFLTSGDRESA